MHTRYSEQFTIDSLSNNAISDLTADYLFDRQHGDGIDRNVLFQVRWAPPFLYVWYRAYPTYSATNVRVLSNGSQVRTEYYDSIFQFQNPEETLGDPAEYLELNEREQIDLIKDFLRTGKARTQCNCGAFYFQGHWEDMANGDHTIFAFPGPKGDGVWRARHSPGLTNPKIRICKHIGAVLDRIIDDSAEIAKELRAQLSA